MWHRPSEITKKKKIKLLKCLIFWKLGLLLLLTDTVHWTALERRAFEWNLGREEHLNCQLTSWVHKTVSSFYCLCSHNLPRKLRSQLSASPWYKIIEFTMLYSTFFYIRGHSTFYCFVLQAFHGPNLLNSLCNRMIFIVRSRI